MENSQIITGYELEKLWRSLPEGESLVISNGKLYQGKVKTEKLTELHVKVVGKNPINLDSNGFCEFIRTKWYVHAPERIWKNPWDKKLTPHLPKESVHPLVIWLQLLLEIIPETDYVYNPEILQGSDYKFFSIGLPKYNTTLFFSAKTGTCHFIKSGNEITWIFGREIPEIK